MVSKVHGDLASPSAYRAFIESVRRFVASLVGRDYALAHDLHPGLVCTQYARTQQRLAVPVQHHHAHGVSCAVEAEVPLPVIAVVCDGMGYGTDGAAWGGEVLMCRTESFERLAHLDYFALPGGDAAARATWRPALSLLRSSFTEDWHSLRIPSLDSVNSLALKTVTAQLNVKLNTPQTSSLGRLFDGVAFLAGVCAANTHEGQAAIQLQAAAGGGGAEPYSFGLTEDDGPSRMDWRPMIREIVRDVNGGASAGVVSARFHQTVAAMFAAAVESAVERTGLGRVVFSGGCFLNEVFRTSLTTRLARIGVVPVCHRRLSTGDAGLSLGQAVIAAAVAAGRNAAMSGA